VLNILATCTNLVARKTTSIVAADVENWENSVLTLSLGGVWRVTTDRRRGASAPPCTPSVYRPYCYAALISTDHNVTKLV